MSNNYRPRLSAELTPEQGRKFFDIMPHGWQKPLCQVLVNGILELYDKGGTDAIAAVISGYIGIDSLISQGLNKTKEVTLKELAEKHPELYMKHVTKDMIITHT